MPCQNPCGGGGVGTVTASVVLAVVVLIAVGVVVAISSGIEIEDVATCGTTTAGARLGFILRG